jgi:hypothetical protein
MATKYIQAQEAVVVTGIGTSETQVVVSGFKNISGDNITQSMIGESLDYVALTISPRTVREEQVLAKVASADGDNITLDIVRAVNPVAPYDAGGGVAKSHNVNDTVVVSNNPALFNKLTAKDNDETVTGNWVFEGDNTYSGDNTHNGVETFTESIDATGATLDIAPATEDTQPYTKGQADALLAAKANDNAVVKLTGNQTVSGVKTFNSSPIVPTATMGTQAVNKSQVEAYIAPNSGDVKASDTAFGTVKLDVAADDVEEPKAVTATADRVAAMAGGGDFGTPNAGNKFLTELTKTTGLVAGETLAGATLPVPVYQDKSDNELYACDANDTAKLKFIGFVTTSGGNAEAVRFQSNGVVGGFSGLAEGEKYYVQDTAGTIGTTPGTYEILVGIAISQTELLIQRGLRRAQGVHTFSETATEVVILGFRPSVVRVFALQNSLTASVEMVSSNGAWTSPNSNACVYKNYNSSGTIWSAIATTSYAWYLSTNSNNPDYHRGSVSVTDSGFSLSNTKNGTIGNAILHWEAEGEF